MTSDKKERFRIIVDGAEYEKGHPPLRIRCPSVSETVSWSQRNNGEPPSLMRRLAGGGEAEVERLAVLGDPKSGSRTVELSIRGLAEGDVDHCRSLIDMDTGSHILDPRPETLEHGWPAHLWYFEDRHTWHCDIHVPERLYAEIRQAAENSVLLVRVDVPIYGRPADLAFGHDRMSRFLVAEGQHVRGAWGLCADLGFERSIGRDASGVLNKLTEMEPQLAQVSMHVREMRLAMMVVVGCVAALTAAWFMCTERVFA
jgi:hypothetical protein